MSSLQPVQMLREAIGPIKERFAYINEQNTLNRLAGFRTEHDPSFNFAGSDGSTLSVKVFTTSGPNKYLELGDVNEPQGYTVLTKTGLIRDYPCIRTNEGALIFVHDPIVTGADKIYQGYQTFVDPQYMAQGENRIVKSSVSEHVPRPMNAFIIYRNAEMAAVRQQYPGIGNNDISRITGQRWRELDSETRTHYKILASRFAQEHRAKHPGYKYTPRKPEDVVRRRKRSAITSDLAHIRNPRIHCDSNIIETRPTSLHYLIPGYPDLDNLTNDWIQEPTPDRFNALMDGFDCALGLAAENNLQRN